MEVKSIEVAIGIAFLYLLLALVASAIVEGIATVRNWRGRMLYAAIRKMLAGSRLLTPEQIYTHPLVLAIARNSQDLSAFDVLDAWGQPSKETRPSYIAPATFSAVVIERLLSKDKSPERLSPEGAIKAIQQRLIHRDKKQADADCETDALRSVLQTTLVTQGPSIPALRFALEKWFTDSMDRITGWYRRRTRASLLMIGLIVAYGGNVDSIAVGRWLWEGDAVRKAVVDSATEYARKSPLTPPPAGSTTPGDGPQPLDLAQFAARIVTVDRNIAALQYPIGWAPASRSIDWFLQYVFGALLTAIAVAMGSTFWFDGLQRLVQIRSTGPKPGPR